MNKTRNLFIGNTAYKSDNQDVKGEIAGFEGEKFFKISHFNNMPPFFMTLVGAGNHWLFISSNGALTAGRRESENALFPYTTDDKITDSAETTGSKSIFRIHHEGKDYLWEPFSLHYEGLYQVERNIYKSVYGNILVFEEINITLEVSFSYEWQFSDLFGFVKTSRLRNLKKKNQEITLLDGLQNILPYGVDEGMQLKYSTLIDAYKKNELDSSSGIGIYYLSSIPTDRAEPSEGLKATTIWTAGLGNSLKLLSSDQLPAFRSGAELSQEEDIRGRRGAYFVSKKLELKDNSELIWITVAELEQDQAAIHKLKNDLKSPTQITKEVAGDLALGTKRLVELVAMADGIQLIEDDLISARHFSNVLFNIMRGGIFQKHYTINRTDLIEYVRHFNEKITGLCQDKLFFPLPEEIEHCELIHLAEETENADLLRLCYEYLPLTFGRRHGDPSRPWNRFYIQNLNSDGSRCIDYQGNWRDIFQNWEALAYSFPEFTEGMICRFLNASTADGYNPYRITKDGIDWEVIDLDDPWSNIGYWGDHQIIYLLRLLEISEDFYPGKLVKWLTEERFVYANVPYRIKNYPEKLENPRDTIWFDPEEADRITQQVKQYGADGKLLWHNEEPYKVNMTEKLLVPLLAKLSNFVTDGGIWLCTQRPEWNDANNALVGSGLSMVTLYHLHRHISFLQRLFNKSETDTINISEEVERWMKDIYQAFSDNQIILKKATNPSLRRNLLDVLGNAVDNYQQMIYEKGFCGKKRQVKVGELLSLLSLVMQYINVSITRNQREDKLFHAYNLMKIEQDGEISIVNLYEMLEGQVAILNSGFLNGTQVLEVLNALKNSTLYRTDQKSYTLYPNRSLPHFLEKNQLTSAEISSFALINNCLDQEDYRVIKPIGNGFYQFNGSFKNSKDLNQMLEELKHQYDPQIIDQERKSLILLFEESFDHHSFTGRSGTFFKYEGLGSIYWHMVAKLALEIQEAYFKAIDNGESKSVCEQLASFYRETKEGLGVHKKPEIYGAFPTDPYSHTPQHSGVQQPGMTGQVKEDILSRWGELGIQIRNGQITFAPSLLQKKEFLTVSRTFTYLAIDGNTKEILISDKAIAFTFCQVPIIFQPGENDQILSYYRDGSSSKISKLMLSSEISAEIFKRSGKVERIEVLFCIFS